MKKTLISALVVGVVLAFAAPTPAVASSTGRCTSSECGQVRNHSMSVQKLTVKRVGGSISLGIGGTTPSGYDWDAIWIPTGRCLKFDAMPNPAYYATRVCVPYKMPGKWFGIPNDGAVRSAYIYYY
jgi:hypothetical protein